MLRIRPGLEDLKTYSVPDVDWPVRLDANERAEDLPPAVRAKLIARLGALPAHRYPEIAQHSLRAALAAGFGLAADNVAVGNGSSEILAACCHVFGGPGRQIVFPWPSFSMYPIYCRLSDSAPRPVALDPAFVLAPDAVLAAARADETGLVILCNPNNPTGGVMAPDEIEYIVAGVRCPVLVDEAYHEFCGQTALGLLAKYPHMAVVRTFSKAFGLAAARVGFALAGRDIIAAINKAMLPYHLNAFSLVAAETAFQMRAEFQPGVAAIVAERGRLAAALAAVPGLTVFPSAANFLLVRTARAGDLAAYLAVGGIGVRDFSAAPGLAGCLRITVGTPAENDALLSAVRQFMNSEV